MLSNVKMSAFERSMDIAPRNDGFVKVDMFNQTMLMFSFTVFL